MKFTRVISLALALLLCLAPVLAASAECAHEYQLLLRSPDVQWATIQEGDTTREVEHYPAVCQECGDEIRAVWSLSWKRAPLRERWVSRGDVYHQRCIDYTTTAYPSGEEILVYDGEEYRKHEFRQVGGFHLGRTYSHIVLVACTDCGLMFEETRICLGSPAEACAALNGAAP